MNKPQIKKHSHEWLADGKLKVWCESDIGDFTVTVDGDTTKELLDTAITEEYNGIKKQQERTKELGIGELVK